MLFLLPVFRSFPHSLMHGMAKSSAHEGSAEGGIASSASFTSSTADNELTAALNQPSQFPTLSNFPRTSRSRHGRWYLPSPASPDKHLLGTGWGRRGCKWVLLNESCIVSTCKRRIPLRICQRIFLPRLPASWEKDKNTISMLFSQEPDEIYYSIFESRFTRRTPLRGYYSSFSFTRAMMPS